MPCFEGLSERQRKLYLLSAVGDAIDLLTHLDRLSEARLEELTKTLTELQEKMVDAVGKPSGQDFLGALGGKAIVSLLRSIGDTIYGASIDNLAPIDRSNLENLTVGLLEAVRSSDIDDYPKRALMMKLASFERVLIECKHYTDDELRRRVKSVLADYWAEAKMHEWKNSPLNEKMLRWATAACRPGIFALALTADISSVVALLPSP